MHDAVPVAGAAPVARGGCWLGALGAAAGLLAAAPGQAASIFIDSSITARETATNNANYGIGPLSQSDDLTELVPAIVLRSVSPRLTVNGNLMVDAIDYRRDTEPDRVLPNGGFEGLLDVYDGHFYVDAAASASQYRAAIFGVNPEVPTTYDTFTTTNERLSPIYKGALPGGVLFVVRADESWIRGLGSGSGAADIDSNLARESLDMDSAPRPFGWSAHAESSQTSYIATDIPTTRETLARFIAKGAFAEEWILGLRAGVEQENFLRNTGARAIAGAGLDWQPSQRTSLEVDAERRFFGAGWTYAVKHVVSTFGLELQGGRDVLTTAESIFATPATGHDMAQLVDAMLLSTTPDPIERAREVQQLLAQQELPDSNAAAYKVFEPTPVQITEHRGALTWIGRRNSASLSAYAVRTVLPGDISPAYVSPDFVGENAQRGLALSLSHRLTEDTTLTGIGRVTITDGVGATKGLYTRQNSLSLQLTHRLGPRTDVFAGARVQAIESDVTAQARERAVLVGATHHF